MLSRDEIIELVNKIIKCEGNEENQDKLIASITVSKCLRCVIRSVYGTWKCTY